MKHELDNAQTAVVLVTSMQKSSSLLHFDRASTKLVPQMYKGEGIAVGGRVVAIMPIQLSSGMAKHVWSAEHPALFGRAGGVDDAVHGPEKCEKGDFMWQYLLSI